MAKTISTPPTVPAATPETKPGLTSPGAAATPSIAGTVQLGVDQPLPTAKADKEKGVPAAGATADLARTDVATRTSGDASDEPASNPFASYALPAADAALASGVHAAETAETTHNVGAALTDVVQSLFQPETVQWMQNRAAYLAANPSEGVLTSAVGSDFGAKFAGVLSQALSDAPREAIRQRYGDSAVTVTDLAKQTFTRMFVNNGLLGEGIPTNQLCAAMGAAFKKMDVQGLVLPDMGASSKPGEVGADAAVLKNTILLPEGKLDASKLPAVGVRGLAMLEAGLEYYIALSSRLVKGDLGKDLAVMSARLSELKKEKIALLAELVRQEAGVVGLEMSSIDAITADQAAKQCTKTWSLAGSIIGLIIVIVVAVVISVFSFGSAAPAMAALVAVYFGCSVAVAAALIIVLAVCAIIAAICTLITTLPDIITVIAMLVRALGFPAAADEIDDASEDMQSWMQNNPWFRYTLMAIQIAASLIMAIIMLPLSAANAAIAVLSTTLEVLDIVAGAITIVVSIANSVIMREIAALQAEINDLQIQMQQLELSMKKLLQKVTQVNQEEDRQKDDIKDRQDIDKNIMTSLEKAADSYAQLLSAVAII